MIADSGRGLPVERRSVPIGLTVGTGERSPADLAEKTTGRIVGTTCGTYNPLGIIIPGGILLVFLLRMPSVTVNMQIIESTVPHLLITGAVVRCSADRADYDIIIFQKPFFANGTSDPCIVCQKINSINHSKICRAGFLLRCYHTGLVGKFQGSNYEHFTQTAHNR